MNNLSTLIVSTTHKALEVPVKKVEFENVEDDMSSHSISSSEESNQFLDISRRSGFDEDDSVMMNHSMVNQSMR